MTDVTNHGQSIRPDRMELITTADRVPERIARLERAVRAGIAGGGGGDVDIAASATTLTPAEIATILVTEPTPNHFNFAFGLPKGVQGAQGPIGLTGAPGAKGDTGAAGAAGATGAQGPKGDKGDTGAMGPIGTVYDSDQIGTIKSFSGKTIPANWALADGTRYTQAAFSQGYDFAKQEADAGNTLWTYRTSDNTFTVPNLTDKFLLTSGGSLIGATGGESSHILLPAETAMKAHSHGGSTTTNNADTGGARILINSAESTVVSGVGPYGGEAKFAAPHGHGIPAEAASNGAAHNNMPPFVAIAQIVKIKGVTIDSGGAITGPAGAPGAAGGQSISFLIGDGVATSFGPLAHNYGTRNVSVAVYRTAPPYDEIEADVERTDINNVTVRTFPVVPAVGAFTMVVSAPGTNTLFNITMDTWHQVGAAGEPAFQNAWTTEAGVGARKAGFRKDPSGRVAMKGLVYGGAVNSAAFTLPVGSRPPINMQFAVPTFNNVFGMVAVNTDGSVVPAVGNNAYFFLDGIEFDTETVLQIASVAAQPLDAWHAVGTAGEPAFANSWANYGGGQPTAGFRRYPDGRVRLRGLVNAGANFATIFVLPAGYRPALVGATAQRFPVATHNGSAGTVGSVQILADGSIQPTTGYGGGGWIDLDGIEFDTETVAAYATGVLGPPTVTALPTNPIDGQECYFLADAANSVIWHLRYRAAAPAPYRWELVGGSALFANETATHNPLTSTATIDKNGGPNLVIPLAGDYDIEFTGELYTNPNNYCYVGIYTAANVAIGSVFYTGNFGGFGVAGTMKNRALALAAQTIKARVWVGGGSGYVQGVRVWARPVRVG